MALASINLMKVKIKFTCYVNNIFSSFNTKVYCLILAFVLILVFSMIAARYIVKKDAPGLKATKIENKIGLRIVQNGDILLKKVFVPDEDRLPGVNSFKDTNKVQNDASLLF